jgi:two-component system chemotaxis sensor kinase CheA
MSGFSLPDHVYTRFRAVSLERVERIEATWLALTHGGTDPAREEELYRDLHTLKGDARVVGFTDVSHLCQRLEDLLAAARARHYRVHEEVDVVVNMGFQFLGMLLRRKQGAPAAGIDLEGYFKQLDDVLGDWLRRSSEAPALGAPGPLHIRLLDSQDRAMTGARNRLSVVATSVYLESLRCAGGAARSRLRDTWRVLAREVALLDASPLAPIVDRHAVAATQLALGMRKNVTVVRDLKDAVIAVDAIDAINTAILHALSNAVDHGVEEQEVRETIGKPSVATISVRATNEASDLCIVIQDDGAGVDLARVRAQAVAKKLIGPRASPTDAELIEVLFEPGFSTRDAVTEVSGRGVGLDAVRGALARVGGSVTLTSTRGQGTALTMRVPQVSRTMDAHLFRAARSGALFAAPATWTASVTASDGVAGVDPAEMLLLPVAAAPAPSRLLTLRRDRISLGLVVGSTPRTARVMRLCPTPDDETVEIVEAGNAEAVLLRPDRMLADLRARTAGP